MKAADDKNFNRIKTFLANLYDRKGEKEKSYKLFNKLIKDNPTFEAIDAYARLLMKEGKLIEGYKLYKDRIKSAKKIKNGGYCLKIKNSKGYKYTYRTADDYEDILEYYGTWKKSEYDDCYSGSASLMRVEL